MSEDASFFTRFCCCSTSAKEEPPVQLITAGSLPQQTQTAANLSKTEETVDGFEDINLAELKMENKAKEVKENGKTAVEKDDFAMNDIMMNEIMQNETLSNNECILEDVISIESNVIEEAREEEFQEYTKGETSGATSPSSSSEKGAAPIDKRAESDDVTEEKKDESAEGEKTEEVEEAEPEKKEAELKEKEAEQDEKGAESDDDDIVDDVIAITGRSDEVVTFEQMMQEGYESTPNTARDSIASVPDARAEQVLAVLSAREADIDSDFEEEGEVEIETEDKDSKPIPSPRSSPPKPSLMYADIDSDDSDEESDTEDTKDRKILEFPARTHDDQDIHKIHMVEVIATDSDVSDSEESDDAPPPPPSTSPPHDEEIENYRASGRNLIDLTTPRENDINGTAAHTRERSGSEKENDGGAQNGVTRLSLKSDGKTTLYTGSGIRVQLESNDVTDDEFSEKLI